MIVSGRGGGLGAYPPNITAGDCIPWEDGKGYERDPDGYIYQWGVPTGKKQCQAYEQLDILPTVHSVPSDVMSAFQEMLNSGSLLAVDEASAQSLCREAQRENGSEALADLYARTVSIQTTAQAHWNSVNEAWSRVQAADNEVRGAYINGNYDDQGVKAQIIAALQAQNHAPMAWNNIQAALDCVWGALDFWVRSVFYGDITDRFGVMQANAEFVAKVFGEVQSFVADLKGNADRVTLSQGAAEAIASAKPYLEDLTALATQIAALFVQAQAKVDEATAGVTNFANPGAVEAVDRWIKEAQPPFIGAGQQAQSIAAEIHQRLDATAAELSAYITQHPELGKPGAGGAIPPTKHTGLWLGVGGVGVLAILIKKGILFA